MLVLEGTSTLGTDFVACLKGFDIIPGDWDIKSPRWSLWGSSSRVTSKGMQRRSAGAGWRTGGAVHSDGMKRPSYPPAALVSVWMFLIIVTMSAGRITLSSGVVTEFSEKKEGGEPGGFGELPESFGTAERLPLGIEKYRYLSSYDNI
jgi:hypothetical protein